MDTFFEQIVGIKRRAKHIVLMMLLWLVAALIAMVAFIFLRAFGLIAAALLFYGAFKLSQKFFIEFEYIVTNGTLDIDKIIAKSSRKRMVSIDIDKVVSVEKFNAGAAIKKDESHLLSCNEDDKNAYKLTVSGEAGGRQVIIFAPNDKIKEAIKKSLPKYIANSAFKEN